jgi:Flp pilus assembly protein TadG
MTFLAALGRDEHGGSLVEAAIIMPTLLMLMSGASDFAMGYWTRMQTQQATARAVELASVGGLENLSVDDLKAEGAAAAKVPASSVTVIRWLECDGVTQSLFEGSCAEGQVVGRYVSVRIDNSYKPILGPLLPVKLAADGRIHFQGFSSLRLQ